MRFQVSGKSIPRAHAGYVRGALLLSEAMSHGSMVLSTEFLLKPET